jgi:hypothetical protein
MGEGWRETTKERGPEFALLKRKQYCLHDVKHRQLCSSSGDPWSVEIAANLDLIRPCPDYPIGVIFPLSRANKLFEPNRVPVSL